MEIKVDTLDFDTLTVIDSNGQSNTINIRQELTINEFNMTQEFMTQASKFAWWASLLERVRAYLDSETRKLEETGSRLTLQIRADLDSKNSKYTKDILESYVKIHPDYQAQSQVVEGWEYRTRQLQYVVKAFETRRDMIIQLGAEQRQTNKNGGITNPYTH